MIAMVNASHSRLQRTDPGHLHVELWTPWSPDAPVYVKSLQHSDFARRPRVFLHSSSARSGSTELNPCT